jgi:molybdopterin-guanine dinucleotide biosynthesis protein A
MDVSGFITAGGRSSRMRRDKAWLELEGRPIICRIIASLAPVASPVTIIANSDEYHRLGLRVVADTHKDVGPLEAIRTALANSPTRRALLVGCDLPFVTTELFRFLIQTSGDYEATVPAGLDDRLQPLCAVYSTEAQESVTSLILSGHRKVSSLFERVRTQVVPFDHMRHLRGAELFFENVNTPEEYARAVKTVERRDRTPADDL